MPAGVTSIFVDLRGASGGYNNLGGDPNNGEITEGLGGRLVGNLAVTPGDVIYINAGGVGNTGTGGFGGAGGYNGGGTGGSGFEYYGGGGGGGASDIRIGGNALANRKMVAGGGGGEAFNYSFGDNGGNGGDLVGMNGSSGGGEPEPLLVMAEHNLLAEPAVTEIIGAAMTMEIWADLGLVEMAAPTVQVAAAAAVTTAQAAAHGQAAAAAAVILTHRQQEYSTRRASKAVMDWSLSSSTSRHHLFR